ncbi:Outer membrane biogenesis protein BamB [Planctomycetales bacterium 10988]|nr:Outer membrane biogenesis protein BamB [Planctomycetales bacterium 10988]
MHRSRFIRQFVALGTTKSFFSLPNFGTHLVLMVAGFSLLAMPGMLEAQEWTRFRGPNGTGISETKTIPTEFNVESALWRVEVPGEGHSQPVLWGQKLFLTTSLNKGEVRSLLCFDAENGELQWQEDYRATNHRKHNHNSFASSTPTVDEEHVYWSFSSPDQHLLLAHDHDGNEVWRHHLGGYESQHSDGTSPILYEEKVILANDQDGESYLLALDRKSGEVIWQTPRPSAKTSYGTPCLFEPEDGQPQLILTSTAQGITSVDPKDGKILWEAPLFTKRSCSSPVWTGSSFVGTCGSGGGGNFLVAVQPGGSGDVSTTHLGYQIRKSSMVPYVPTPIVYNGYLFLWTDAGIVSCVEAESGVPVWQKRVGEGFFASPICIDGKIYCTSTSGTCVVLDASSEFQILAKNEIGEGSHATPAVANGRLYLRTFGHLMAFGK